MNVEAGTTVSHYVELATSPATPAVSTGRLDVASDPSGAQVSVDGADEGTNSVDACGDAAGRAHRRNYERDKTVNRKVSVTAGNTASVFASLVRRRHGGRMGGVQIAD